MPTTRGWICLLLLAAGLGLAACQQSQSGDQSKPVVPQRSGY